VALVKDPDYVDVEVERVCWARLEQGVSLHQEDLLGLQEMEMNHSCCSEHLLHVYLFALGALSEMTYLPFPSFPSRVWERPR
jgi:hypothetical protein